MRVGPQDGISAVGDTSELALVISAVLIHSEKVTIYKPCWHIHL